MLKSYIAVREAARRRLNALRSDKRGVVSFEYIIVAACVVTAVAAVFGGTAAGSIQDTLTKGLAAIVAKIPT